MAQSKAHSDWYQPNQKIKILTTTAMIGDLVSYIVADQGNVMTLIYGELDPHSYELVKGDDEKFVQADLIFYNGLGLEHGLSLRQNLLNNAKAISLGDPLLKSEPSSILTVDGQFDPHIWMDVSLWAQTIPTIVEALVQRDPEHRELYQARARELESNLRQLDHFAYEQLQQIPPEKRYLVTSHDAFNYFTRRYLSTPEELKNNGWQVRFSAPEGLAPDAQLSIMDIVAIIEHIQKFHVCTLFPESNVSRDSLHKIQNAVRQKGRELHLCSEPLYGDTMGKKNYAEMIRHNVQIIKRELHG